MNNIKRLGLTAFIAILSSLVTFEAISHFGNNDRNTTFEQKQAAAVRFASLGGRNYSPATFDFTYAASMTAPGVVHIKTSYAPRKMNRNQTDPFRNFFGDQFFNQPDPYHSQPEESSGSGVIISDDGYIVTNNHVVDDGDKIEVILFNKKSYQAKVIGTDPNTDLALLKIDEKKLPFIVFGNSDSVKVGQWVLAVGNPLYGLESTATAGIISAKGRNLNILKDNGSIESYIQTDAAVNPGNSGGALVNTNGELIGIISAIASPTGYYAGYSFAVPVNIASKVVNDLMKYGQVQRGYLGIQMSNIDEQLAKGKNLSNYNGVYVDTVLAGSSAREAGLRTGDILIKVNGVTVNSTSEVQEQVARFHPGDKVNITFLRDGSEKTITTTLKNKDGAVGLLEKPVINNFTSLGAQFSDITPKEMRELGISGGVKVVKLNDGLLARNTDIHEGFIITKVDKTDIKNIGDLKAALQDKKGGVMIQGTYPNAPGQYFYAFGM